MTIWHKSWSVFFFYPKTRGKKKTRKYPPTYLFLRRPSLLYVITRKRKNYTPLLFALVTPRIVLLVSLPTSPPSALFMWNFICSDNTSMEIRNIYATLAKYFDKRSCIRVTRVRSSKSLNLRTKS